MPLKIMSIFLFAAAALYPADPFQPAIAPNGVVNAASYLTAAFPNYGLARGSLFLVFGTALGPQNVVSATFPLPTSDGLAGTRVLISNGGYSAACPMVYTSLTQVAALVPSNAPEGDGTLVVAYQNLASASVPIHIVHSAFGIFTLNQAGSGPAILQNFVSQASTPVNTLIAAAHPRQTVTLWGTGLGPANGDETAGPVPGSLPFVDNVYVGGVPVPLRYAGRSGCCAGVDQISFDIPTGITGCYVPVAVQSGGVLSNIGTISVSASGSECDDPLSFRAADLITFERNGFLRAGQASLSLNTVFGNSAGELNLAATFLSFNSQALIQGAGRLNPSLGSCYLNVTKVNADPAVVPQSAGMDAGATVTANGPGGPITAPSISPGVYSTAGAASNSSANSPGVSSGVFSSNLGSGTYQFAGTGGSSVGAFQTTFTVATSLQWTNAGAFATGAVSTAQPLTVTWTGGDPNGHVAIQITSANAFYNSSILCNAPSSPGAFTVPAYIMATVLQSIGSLSVTAVSAPASITATGLDTGAITIANTTQVQANFQAPPR